MLYRQNPWPGPRSRVLAVGITLLLGGLVRAEEPPRDWIEPETGHRVLRLSDVAGSRSLYFHQNPYTADGDKLVIETPTGLATVDLATRAITEIVTGEVSRVVVAPKSRIVYYFKDDTVYATHVDTRATRAILSRADLRSGSGFTVNADETLLAGSLVRGPTPRPTERPRPVPGSPPSRSGIEARWLARLPMALYTIDVRTGELRTFHEGRGDWLNHVQFSPTDPSRLMFCHEGPWHRVDRIWTIRTDGTERRLMHARTMEMEIAGHEFWSGDGRTVWYDLQTPRSVQFWLAGVGLDGTPGRRYPIARESWSVHYNVSPDGRLFAGDGGGPRSVAAPGNGQWIYLFTPKGDELVAERLVDLSKHDYALEPNVTFTPDQKWLVFRSNMHGASHVYAVEVARRPPVATHTVPWREAHRQEEAWYAGDDARAMAENVLHYQNADGGWPKNIDMARREAPRQASTIDNGATTAEMEFLARVFGATGRRRYADAVLRGIDYLLAAQYPNGGWPQYFPAPTGYHRHITFNDDAMVRVLDRLRQVAARGPRYAFVDETRAARCARAVERGIDCILKCQIVVKGVKTGWCAQHDEVTLAPTQARSYELPSTSGREGAWIVRFLMSLDRPRPEVVAAVQAAVAWFERVKISGIRVDDVAAPSEPTGRDRVVVADPQAPPLWARFYEIDTDRPIFSSRCEVAACASNPWFMVRPTLAEIENERRAGYQWYTRAPASVLRDYPAWRERWAPPAEPH